MITINGKSYEGNNIVVNKDMIIIDGRTVEMPNEKIINISVVGNINDLTVSHCDTITISGNASSVRTVSGDVSTGSVTGDVNITSGDLTAEKIGGSVHITSGDIKYKNK